MLVLWAGICDASSSTAQVTSYTMLPFCVRQFLAMHLEDRYRIFSTECAHSKASLVLKVRIQPTHALYRRACARVYRRFVD